MPAYQRHDILERVAIQYEVGGIPVVAFSGMEEAVSAIFSPVDHFVIPGFAIAINPEKVMKARDDRNLMDVLLSASFRFADGIGVVWALRCKGAKSVQRIPGCELWESMMKRAGELGVPVFLVGSQATVLDQVSTKLSDQLQVDVVGKQDGFFGPDNEAGVIERIKSSGAKIVTVAMGSPKQELFIMRCRAAYPDAFYMGVGGTYDVFVGNVQRAPAWACQLNMEWLYRLVKQPTRFGRQIVLLKYMSILLFGRL